ncbi:hypothetical protein ACI2UC_20340 [Ralstonia nicotianae]
MAKTIASDVITLPTAATTRVRQTPGRRPKGLLSLCEARRRKACEPDAAGQSVKESLRLLGMRANEAQRSGSRHNPYPAGSPRARLFEILRDKAQPNPIPSYAVDLLKAAKRVARLPADSTPELLAQYRCDLESAVTAFEAAMPVVDGVIAEYGRGA